MLPLSSHIAVRPGATLRFTETSAEHAAIKQAMARHDDNAVRKQLARANLAPDAVQALLAHVFRQKNSLATKEALLRHPACDAPTRQTALALAVQHHDLPFTRKALQAGADPQLITAHPQDNGIRFLLTYARRKNKLYPHAPSAQETDLDRALRNGLDESAKKEAWDLLLQATPGKNIQEAWRDAVKAKQLDIQRAILLLKADRDRRFRLLEDAAVTDPGVAEVMKEIPYFSPKRKLLLNFSGETTFPGTKEEIVCRHLVEHRQSVQERHPRIKFENAHFASIEAVAKHVSYATEAKYAHLTAHATEAHLFHNREFGKTLVQQLAAMAAEDESSRLILLLSTDHVMSVRLKRKEKDGNPQYVVELFDPNLTTSDVRIASDSLFTLETLTLENLIDGAEQYKEYYPEPNGLSMMFVRPPPLEEPAMTGPARGAVENRTLTSSIADKDINATALFLLLNDGFAGDLRRLKEEIASRPERERVELLEAKDAEGCPGLYMALEEGHADAIRAFGELLPLVPEDQRAALLAAKEANGKFGLAAALKEGNLEAVEQYMEIVKKTAPALSAQDRAALLKDIRKSHAVQILGMWSNFSHYAALKKKNPDFYLRFKEMKNALKP